MTSNKLNRLLHKKGTRLFFRARVISHLKAAKGFIEILKIPQKHVVVGYADNAIKHFAKRIFSNYQVIADRTPSPDWLSVQFDTYGFTRILKNELIIGIDPYKYFHPENLIQKQTKFSRQNMRIAANRKIIVASSPDQDEVKVIIKAYRNLPLNPKPLLILGLNAPENEPDHSLKDSLLKMGFRVTKRGKHAQSLSSFGKSDIVILNTRGELLSFFKTADLAIVGYERNLFEPAAAGVPILYFAEPLDMRKKERRLMKEFGLIWRRNETSHKLLETARGGAQINPDTLTDQILDALDHPDYLVEGAQKALKIFKHKIIPIVRVHGTRTLIKAVLRN